MSKNLIIIIIIFISINLLFANKKQISGFDLSIDMNSTWAENDSTYIVIIPTNEKNEEIEKEISKTAKRIFTRFKIISDVKALEQDLSSKNIIVYGTQAGNLWLNKYFKKLPIKITKNQIIADKEYNGNNLRLITVWKNPLNPNNSLMIYTAQKAKDIPKIHSVFHGNTQFAIASGKKVLQASFYTNKNGVWDFSDMPDFNFPKMSKEKMYDDYDFFMKIIEDIFPMKEVNKEIYGVNIDQLLIKNRKKIEKLISTIEFVQLLRETIISCRGSHFWLGCSGKREYYNDFVEESSYRTTKYYEKYFQLKSKYLRCYIPLFYFKGDYYFKYDVSYKDIKIAKGSKLIKFCNKTPDNILTNANRFANHFSWDYNLQKNISTNFPYFLNPDSIEVLSFEIKDTEGKNISFSMNKNESFAITYSQKDQSYEIEYLENDKILYVKLPKMDKKLIDIFQKDIFSYKDKSISAVIVDIRNNGGGSDFVWSKLLSMIIDKPFVFSHKLGIKNSERNLTYIKHHPIGVNFSDTNIEEIDFLRNEKFLTATIYDTIPVNENSLKYEGKIYVLSDNIYSSAGSFMNICKQSDRLISVGRQNNKILGVGIDPYCFSLPFSKVIFTIEPIADFTHANNAKDMHHIDVESKVDLTIESLINYYNYKDDIETEDFLYNHDPFFKKVLMMLKNDKR